jgi:hypothetical protein
MKIFFFGLIAILFFSCTSIAQTNQERKPVSVVFTAEADIISAINGCYTLQVRVYMTIDGDTTLVSWATVQSGDCGQRRETNANKTCKDQEFKGDYFYYTADSLKYCLVDLLQDEVIYSKYIIEKDRVINSVKK